MHLLIFLCAAILYSLGGVCMKASEGLTKPGPSVLLFALFFAAAACQSIGMRNAEMGSSYVLVLGLEAIVAVALGMWFFGDHLTQSNSPRSRSFWAELLFCVSPDR